MLVPIIGMGWTLALDGLLLLLVVGGLVAFCHWLDGPRRDLVAEIRKRPFFPHDPPACGCTAVSFGLFCDRYARG